MSDPRTLAIVREYSDLIAAIRARMDELELTFDILDHRSGVQVGYSAKILGPTPTKSFGPVSLGCILGALRMKLIAIEDEDAAQSRHQKLERRRMPANRPNVRIPWLLTPLRARELNRIRWRTVSARERRRIAVALNKARWG